MTEQEWLRDEDPKPMLNWLTRDRRQASSGGVAWLEEWEHSLTAITDRQLRLWCWAMMELSRYHYNKRGDFAGWEHGQSCEFERKVHRLIATAEAWADVVMDEAGDPGLSIRAALLREVKGNPFRKVGCLGKCKTYPCCKGLCPARRAILDWNGGIAAQLAQGIWQDQAWDRMPILGDALEEAGCSQEDILRHLRGYTQCRRCIDYVGDAKHSCPPCQGTGWIKTDTPHIRGCWALDLALGND